MSNNNNRILSQPISYQELKELTFYKKIPISGIYKIENIINHKVYIGQSKNVIARCFSHLQPKGEHCVELLNDFQKYGYDKFSFEVVKQTYDLDYWETFIIQIYNATDERYGYNISTGGRNPKGERFSKILSESLKGHIVSEETKQKISMRNKGQESPYKGKHPSMETRYKQSIAKKGKPGHSFSIESRKQISDKLKGHPVSEETRLKISQSLKRNPKHSLSHIGKKASKETKIKLSETHKGRHHYNNGVIEICVKEPPLGSEWKLGRLKRIKEV